MKTLNEDCLPEKYLLMDEAVKRRDAPRMPNPHPLFGIHEFKIIFRKYYEAVLIRSKQMRKSFL